MMMNKRSGSVVLYALMVLAAMLFLVQGIIKGVFINNRFTANMLAREQAELLAYSGIELARAQLMLADDAEEGASTESADEQKKPDEAKKAKGMLKRVLPHLNRWQTCKLNNKTDQVDGTITFCISSENGKLNINEVFNFEQMAFKKPFDDIIKKLEIKPTLKQGEVHDRLVEFFKKHKKRLYDVSELLLVPGLQSLDIFYSPPPAPAKGKPSVANVNVTLLDVFTVWTPDDKINPLWFSDSWCGILGLRRPHADDAEKQKEVFKKVIEQCKPEAQTDWDNQWSILEPMYGQKPKIISAIKENFPKEFGSTVYSVLSCGKVEEVECKLLAILQLQTVPEKKTEKPKDKAQNEVKSEPGVQPKKELKILRIYWL